MIIGREKEISTLNELYESGSAEMIALYGRRRVGKTYLIDEVFENRIIFRHAGLSPLETLQSNQTQRPSRMKDQLKHFAHSLQSQGMRKAKIPASWLDAFYLLEEFLLERDDGKTRLLIFIDEIQWMDTPRAGFLTGLEAFWNGWACHRHNVMLIVCGSSTSWILNKLVNNHGGLYGRLTWQMKLEPFTLKECERFLQSRGVILSRYDIVQAYMMVGGIPYYLKYFDRRYSLAQNIDAMFFGKAAPLLNEFDRLLSSLFSNPEEMKSIVIALSQKNMGLTRKELIDATGIPDSGDFSDYLKALISGGFIMKYHSFGESKRIEYYKLIDPFCNFYLRFVRENEGKRISWINIAEGGPVITWRGYAFENVCFHHVPQIKAALGISGVTTRESMWLARGDKNSSGAQIDMIIERNDHIVHMCEIKFYSEQFVVDKDYHFTLVRRQKLLFQHIPKKSIIWNTFISTYGLYQNEYSSDFLHSITLDNLFSF